MYMYYMLKIHVHVQYMYMLIIHSCFTENAKLLIGHMHANVHVQTIVQFYFTW